MWNEGCQMRVIFAGGGTGGHIYPAVTLAKEFVDRDPKTEILFVGGKKGLESDIIPREGFNLVTLELAGIPRRVSPEIFRSIWLAGKGVMDTFKIIREFHPNLVVGTGGYVCGPMVLAASLSKIPTAIQEQNAFPGLTNRMLGKVVDRVILGYSEAGRYFKEKKIRVLGNPIRTTEFAKVNRSDAEKALGLKPGGTNLLVFGGSQSARKINEAFMPLLPGLLSRYPQLQIMLMTGQKDYDKMLKAVADLNLDSSSAKRIHLAPYFYNIAQVYAATDLVLARAGALSLAEITCFGIPAILVPYPFATNNHQEYNARVLEKNGAATVILETELTSEKLNRDLESLLTSSEKRSAMAEASRALSRPQATAEIVSELLKLL
jgi:UDP-N-acetylglucosamine--N-acetylmuramyl-(pentapeptide) pyrophosphoryl-undecaprenol N-acetylglucosamine transferase